MALDWGTKRIGIAVSDALGITVRGIPTLKRKTPREDYDALIGLIREARAETVIVGDPRRADGRSSGSSRKAARFAFQLGRHAGLKVQLWDEQLTSWEARQALKGRPRAPGDVDRMAAVILLESYLEATKTV